MQPLNLTAWGVVQVRDGEPVLISSLFRTRREAEDSIKNSERRLMDWSGHTVVKSPATLIVPFSCADTVVTETYGLR